MFKFGIVTLFLWCLTLVVMPAKSATDDPTRPPNFSVKKSVVNSANGRSVEQTPRWVLSSTLVSSERRSAILNGKIVVAGDVIQGARVVQIEPSKLVLSRQGKKIELFLLEKSIKQPASKVGGQEGQ